MTQVKICGLNHPDAIDSAVDAGADWIGFVFFPASPRFVSPQRAAMLASRSGGTPLVGLFVNPTRAEIEQALSAVPLDALQLYGVAAELPALRAAFGIPVWRAVGISAVADLPDGMDGADRLLIEAKPPKTATRPGGNAVAFDWSLLRDWVVPGPWMLAGGLTPDNVTEAIRATAAPAVDVSSGVERRPGEKDPALIRRFIEQARAAG